MSSCASTKILQPSRIGHENLMLVLTDTYTTTNLNLQIQKLIQIALWIRKIDFSTGVNTKHTHLHTQAQACGRSDEHLKI